MCYIYNLLQTSRAILLSLDFGAATMPFGFVSGGDGSSPEELFRSVPVISRALIVGMVGTLFCEVVRVFSPIQYALSWPLVWNNFHLWRFVSSAVYPGPPSLSTLFHMVSVGMFSIRCGAHTRSIPEECLRYDLVLQVIQDGTPQRTMPF